MLTWMIYAVVVAGFLAVGGLALERIFERCGLAAAVRVARSAHLDGNGPALGGFLRPAVVIPRWILSLDARTLATVVRHEREHARVGDHLLLLYSGLVAAAFPWSPAVWWMCSRLRTEGRSHAWRDPPLRNGSGHGCSRVPDLGADRNWSSS